MNSGGGFGVQNVTSGFGAGLFGIFNLGAGGGRVFRPPNGPAVLVPVVYLVYLYDLNVWEDEPAGVIVGCIALSALLGTGFTLIWRNTAFKRVQLPVNLITGQVSVRQLLVTAFLVPVGIVFLSQVGPILLASRPSFNHMLDGLTFGVVSASSFVAAETLVAHHSLISSLPARVSKVDAGLFVSVVINAAIIRPLFFGCLIGYLMAEYSGLGTGAGKIGGRYLRALVESVAAAIVFCVGSYMFGLIQGVAGALLGLLWATAMLVVISMRLRVRIHDALLEEALEAVQAGSATPDHAVGRADCPQCDMPLLDSARFCNQCGMSELATSKSGRTVAAAPAAIAIQSNEGEGR